MYFSILLCEFLSIYKKNNTARCYCRQHWGSGSKNHHPVHVCVAFEAPKANGCL